MTTHCDLCREPVEGAEVVCPPCGFAVCPLCQPQYDELHRSWHEWVCRDEGWLYDGGDPIMALRNAAILSITLWLLGWAAWRLLF